MTWLVKDPEGYYWVGPGLYDARQSKGARFPVYAGARAVARECGGVPVRLLQMPECPICRTRTLMRLRDGHGRHRIFGKNARSSRLMERPLPAHWRLPECMRCFIHVVTPRIQKQIWAEEIVILRRTLPERVYEEPV